MEEKVVESTLTSFEGRPGTIVGEKDVAECRPGIRAESVATTEGAYRFHSAGEDDAT